MAAAGDTSRYESSAEDLSSPPSGSLSEPGSPSRTNAGRQSNGNSNHTMDRGEIVVGNDQRQPSSGAPPQQQRQITFQQYQQPSPGSGSATGSATGAVTGTGTGPGSATGGRQPAQKRFEFIDGKWVQLTAAGVPRKKPGRKPGSVLKPKTTAAEGADQPKIRKARKPRDLSAPAVQRKRKIAAASDVDTDGDASSRPATASASGTHTTATISTSSPSHHHHHQQLHPSEHRYSPKMAKREGYPSSMQSILNADPPSNSASNSTSFPVRSSGLSYDPIRGNYDPVRETMTSHSSSQFQPTGGSPRGPTHQPAHRSPSIANMVEPTAPAMTSPSQSHQGYQPGSRLHAQDSSSMPPSPSYRPTPTPTPAARPAAQEAKKDAPPPPPPAPRPVVNQANFTTISNGPVRKIEKPHTGVSTPRTDNLDDAGQDSEGRSILDFGRAKPGEELQAPTIVLNIPIKAGETNKYVNFMRMAEERYGWDALHPRLAANRDRKARIAAAAASLEKIESGRESGDEMSVDLSDGEASNPENGGTSGPDAQAKPKKKRNFKEDQYDVDDDFVDDSELLWEAQAAASRDGFFVYSGPLVPEVEKPPAGYVNSLALTLVHRAKQSTVTNLQSVDAVAGAVVAAEGRREGVPLAAAAAQAPEGAPSHANLELPNPKSSNASERRLSERAWPSSPWPRRMDTCFSPPRRLLRSVSSALREMCARILIRNGDHGRNRPALLPCSDFFFLLLCFHFISFIMPSIRMGWSCHRQLLGTGERPRHGGEMLDWGATFDFAMGYLAGKGWDGA